MPLYVYVCNECGATKEVLHKMAESPVVKCEQCSSVMYRQVANNVGVIYRGDWFKTKGQY